MIKLPRKLDRFVHIGPLILKEDNYNIAPARYAKNQYIVQPFSNGSGYKTRGDRLCCHLNGRWSNRERGYIMSAAKAEKFQTLYETGRDANSVTGELYDD